MYVTDSVNETALRSWEASQLIAYKTNLSFSGIGTLGLVVLYELSRTIKKLFAKKKKKIQGYDTNIFS